MPARFVRAPSVLCAGIAFAGLLSACLFQASDPNPYSGLSCAEKIDKMGKELVAFEASQPKMLLKASAVDTTAVDSVITVSPADSIPAVKADSASDTSHSATDTTRATKIRIQIVHGYPPVSGLDPTTPAVTNSTASDSRAVSYTPGQSPGTVQWIPPVGFPGAGANVSIDTIPSLTGIDTTRPENLPPVLNVIQIVTSEAYIAHIRIYDYRNRLVREMDQDFGQHGELSNPNRIVLSGKVSYLVWDIQDAAGKPVEDGTYVWKIHLVLQSARTLDVTAKTGVLDPACTTAP